MKPTRGQGSKHSALLTTRSERNRMLAMAALFVLCLIAFFSVRSQEDRYRDGETEGLPPAEEAQPLAIATPQIDGERLGALVTDQTDTDRVLLDREAIELALNQTRGLLDAHFAPLAGRALDDLAWRELEADPGGWRGALFRVRGQLEELKREDAAAGELWRGRVTTGDGHAVFFALSQVPEGLALGDWIRFDALFLKAFRDEVAGSWTGGPLLAGRRALRSFAPLGTVTELTAQDLFDVIDADPDSGGKLEDHTQELYRLMAYARDAPPGAVDWDAAPELDSDTLNAIFNDPAAWRGRPVRLPVLRLLGVTNIAPGENPARLERIADGWIGSQTWTVSNGLVHFRAPFTIDELQRNDLITGRAFFLMNEKYVPSKGDLAVASFFVLERIERHVPAPDHFARNLMIALSALVVALIGVFWFALTRDARRSKELRAELVRRRRERRDKTLS